MNEPEQKRESVGAERLPFEPATVLRGVWHRRRMLAGWLLLSLALGLLGGVALGYKVWQAEAVLLYQPPSKYLLGGMYEAPSIKTQLHMVKVEPNLAETRLRLGLEATLGQVARSCAVENPRESQLLVMRAHWGDAETAARIADTLCDVFVARQQKIRRQELATIVRDLETRLTALDDEMQAAGVGANTLSPRKLQELHQREIELFHNRLNGIDMMYERAVADRKAAERQLEEILRITAEVKKRIADEASEAGELENLTNLNVRVERLRESILDDKSNRMQQIVLEQWKERLAHSHELLEKGYISQEEYRHELDEYEKAKVAAVDTEQIKAWKVELEQLYKQIRPSEKTRNASAPILHNLLMRRYNIDLDIKGAEQRIEQIEVARRRQQREFSKLVRSGTGGGPGASRAESWQKERDELEAMLAKVRAMHDADESDFAIVSTASAPSRPSRSYRKVFSVLIAGLCGLLGAGLIVGGQLFDTTVKSRPEATLRFGLPVLGILPQVDDARHLAAGDDDGPLADPVRSTARRLRTLVPERGACVMFVSAMPGEGRTTAAAHLASCFGQQGERVLVVDGQVRQEEEPGPDLHSVIHARSSGARRGLGDYLAGDVDRLADLLTPTDLPGVRCIPRSESPVTPDLLRSRRMRTLLDGLLEDADLILIDGPPSMRRADDEILAEQVDGIVLVVESGRCRAAQVQATIDRLATVETPIVGVILNRVEKHYLQM